jgi:hypothetical protein
MGYKPILETSDLPTPKLPIPEHLRFDMKMQLSSKPTSDVDLATDVAALANARGGVLLIGAHEYPRDSGLLHAYHAMSFVDAQAIATTLKRALQLCSPKPIAEAKPIALLPGGPDFVVAINCDPYAAPPIGVAHQVGNDKWWAFPVRRGRDNHMLRPEELSTIMEPRLRRITLQLDQLPMAAPTGKRLVTVHSASGTVLQFFIESIDDALSLMLLRSAQDPHDVIVPLEAVRMVWREADNGVRAHVAITGSIVADSTRALRFDP